MNFRIDQPRSERKAAKTYPKLWNLVEQTNQVVHYGVTQKLFPFLIYATNAQQNSWNESCQCLYSPLNQPKNLHGFEFKGEPSP